MPGTGQVAEAQEGVRGALAKAEWMDATCWAGAVDDFSTWFSCTKHQIMGLIENWLMSVGRLRSDLLRETCKTRPFALAFQDLGALNATGILNPAKASVPSCLPQTKFQGGCWLLWYLLQISKQFC